MATNNDPSLDSGKPIAPLSPTVISTIQSYRNAIAAAAQATGLRSAEVAAPMAREMNKVASGDYDYPISFLGGFKVGAIVHAMAEDEALYGTPYSPDVAPISLANAQYVTNMNFVKQNNIVNNSNSPLQNALTRMNNPVLNDLGVAHIQLGAAMQAIEFYNENHTII
jgi:hypothetical protein